MIDGVLYGTCFYISATRDGVSAQTADRHPPDMSIDPTIRGQADSVEDRIDETTSTSQFIQPVCGL